MGENLSGCRIQWAWCLVLLFGSAACRRAPPAEKDRSTDTSGVVEQTDSGDTATPTVPWCAKPAEAVEYVDIATEWGLVDTIDGTKTRYEHNPVAMADLDGDGDDDILIALRDEGLYLNLNEGGSFRQELVAELPLITSIALGDVDGDRDLDVALFGWTPQSTLLLNDGSAGFSDATKESGLGEVKTADAVRHATFGDLDGDGALDLFLSVATQYDNQVPNTMDRLILGDGTGGFVDASDRFDEELRTGLSWATVFVDFDRDGDQDLYTVTSEQSDHGPSRLLRNDGQDEDGAFVFSDLSESCSCSWTGSTMGVSEADFDLDGLPDFYLTNTGASMLLVNLGDGSFADSAAAMGAGTLTDSNAMTYGAAIFDHDNDGWLDILAAAGPLRGDQPMPSQPDEQPDVLLKGGPDGFTDISAEMGIDDAEAGRGVSVGMLDDDGMLEAVVTHLDAPSRLFRSDCTADRALVVDLLGHPPNTFGIGARVEVELSDRVLSRPITTNSGWGSTIHPRAHFGLGDEAVESLVVTWPSGAEQQVDVDRWVDGRILVEEP
jgi:hypothetical protein